MILGIVTTILASIGIYGFYSGNYLLLYIGLTASIVEHITGIASGQEKGLTTVWIALLFAFGMIMAGSEWLSSIAICLCFETTILFFVGIVFILFASFTKKN